MCSVVAVSCHSTNGKAGQALDISFTCLLLPVNEIGKRLLHPLEHSAGFFLRSIETVLDRTFRAPDNAGSFSASLLIVAFDVLHGGPGKHAFRSHYGSSRSANINRADRT